PPMDIRIQALSPTLLWLKAERTSHRICPCVKFQCGAFPKYPLLRGTLVERSTWGWPKVQSVLTEHSIKYFSKSGAQIPSDSQESPINLLVGNENIGVLLLNLGGPESLDDVQPFLFNLFAD
ncbi:ferrochelatase, partial [Genlisea aurea]